VNRLNRLLSRALSDRAVLGVQNPVVLGPHSQPQPDIAVLRPRRDAYASRHPEPPDILLLIEVADSSLERDREEKVPAYATALVAEAWLVNLPGDTLEVYREPRGGRYHDVRRAGRGEAVRPLAFPDLLLQVDDILGPASS